MPPAVTCPSCGADLRPFTRLKDLGDKYLRLARHALSSGDVDKAGKVIAHLAMIVAGDNEEYLELKAKLLLATGELSGARELADMCPEEIAAWIGREVAVREREETSAKELYNYALSAARRQDYQLASRALADAVNLTPHQAALWQLKLKVNLKAGQWGECYEDLAALDSIGARPIEFTQLEQFLPPVNTT